MSVADAFAVLRDHGEAGLAYRPDRHLLMRHVCAHAANALTRDAAQSTASLVAHLQGSARTIWVTGTSAPCTSVFKPVWFGGAVLPALGPAPGPVFDEGRAWWRHERVHRRALRDLPRALELLAPDRDALEQRLLDGARAVEGGTGGFSLTEEAFRRARGLDDVLLTRLDEEPGTSVKLPPTDRTGGGRTGMPAWRSTRERPSVYSGRAAATGRSASARRAGTG